MLTRRTRLQSPGLMLLATFVGTAAGPLQTLEQFFGFRMFATKSRKHETRVE